VDRKILLILVACQRGKVNLSEQLKFEMADTMPILEENQTTEEDDFVTPWDVQSSSQTGIDYGKLISESVYSSFQKGLPTLMTKGFV